MQRKNLYGNYFANNEFPICEDGNGSFLIFCEENIILRNYLGDTVEKFKSLEEMLAYLLLELEQGRIKLSIEYLEEIPTVIFKE